MTYNKIGARAGAWVDSSSLFFSFYENGSRRSEGFRGMGMDMGLIRSGKFYLHLFPILRPALEAIGVVNFSCLIVDLLPTLLS